MWIVVVWLSGRNVVEFYGDNGSLLKAVSLRQQEAAQGKAA